MTERLHWKDAEHAVAWLKGRPSDLRTLVFVARLPFVHEYVIEGLVGLSGGASIYRSLARLRSAGLLATIRPPLYPRRSQELYYLTDLGLATLALNGGIEVSDLVSQLHIGGRHLLAVLPQLEHLVAAYDLLGALAASRDGWPSLLAWERPYRRHYYRPTAKNPVSIKVPAYAALSWDGEPGAYFLVPDRGVIPRRLYRPMIDHLFAMRRSDYRTFPILVVATWDEEGKCGWEEMLEEVRRARGDIQLLAQFTYWGTLRGDLTGIEQLSRVQQFTVPHLRQHFPWQRFVPRRSNSPIPHPVGDALIVPTEPTVVDSVERVALRLTPGDYEALDLVAEHPYLTPDQMAAVLGGSLPTVRRRRNRLLGMGVMRLVGDEEIGRNSALELPELMVEGLDLVAAHRGLSLPVAARALGLIGGSPDQPYGPRRRLLLHLAHTRGADDIFIGLYRTAAHRRDTGHDDVMVQWDNGTMCSRRHLRPDGYGIYQHDGQFDGFFLEFDRGTMRRHGYLDKFDEYYDYASSRRFERDYHGYPTILFVTVNNRTEGKIAEMAQVAARRYGFPLPILLTCLWRIDDPTNTDGLLGCIWRAPDTDFHDRRHWIRDRKR